MENSTLRTKYPIHKDLVLAHDKKVNISLKSGIKLIFDNVLEFSTSRFHICLVLRTEDNQSESVCIPKDQITLAERYVFMMDRFVPIKMTTRRLTFKD